MQLVQILVVVLCTLCATALGKDVCRTVPEGGHYAQPAEPFAFVTTPWREVEVTLKHNCVAHIAPACKTSWNKLWGSSRCGYLNHHHWNSDRFVWRRALANTSMVELAAYAYDNGTKPYSPPNANLLQPFRTLVAPGQRLRLRMRFQQASTDYFLVDPTTNSTVESKTVQHKTQCHDYNIGYRLGFYFGGSCPAPAEVTACYGAEHDYGD